MLSVGTKLRDYEVVAHLRSGGMASLYLGRRQGPDGFAKLVAIKVVNGNLSRDPGFIRMFVDEAKISACIDHPNVVHVEELGEVDGLKFLVMEYVHGVSLGQLLGQVVMQQRRLTPEIAVHIAVRVAEGLHAAHETRGHDGQLLHVVHRDISPQNILVSASGHVKLIDFGIAKARGRSQQTTSTSLKGKIRYMSPEQAYGTDVDRRCDVYALGVVLWEMLTAQRMFIADTDLAVLDMVRNPVVPKPSTIVPAVSPELDAVVMAALAPKVGDRIPTAQELRRRLAIAMPSALTLDASALAELLESAMGEELSRQRDRIAASANGQMATNIMPRVTMRTMGLEHFTTADQSISVKNAPGAWAEAIAQSAEAPMAQTPAPQVAPMYNTPSHFTPASYTPTPVVTRVQSNKPSTGVIIALIVAFLLAIGVIVAAAVVVWQRTPGVSPIEQPRVPIPAPPPLATTNVVPAQSGKPTPDNVQAEVDPIIEPPTSEDSAQATSDAPSSETSTRTRRRRKRSLTDPNAPASTQETPAVPPPVLAPHTSRGGASYVAPL